MKALVWMVTIVLLEILGIYAVGISLDIMLCIVGMIFGVLFVLYWLAAVCGFCDKYKFFRWVFKLLDDRELDKKN